MNGLLNLLKLEAEPELPMETLPILFPDPAEEVDCRLKMEPLLVVDPMTMY